MLELDAFNLCIAFVLGESTGWVQKGDGAMENVDSLLDLGTAAAVHFCRSS
jgi:hypothetical protein